MSRLQEQNDETRISSSRSRVTTLTNWTKWYSRMTFLSLSFKHLRYQFHIQNILNFYANLMWWNIILRVAENIGCFFTFEKGMNFIYSILYHFDWFVRGCDPWHGGRISTLGPLAVWPSVKKEVREKSDSGWRIVSSTITWIKCQIFNFYRTKNHMG